MVSTYPLLLEVFVLELEDIGPMVDDREGGPPLDLMAAVGGAVAAGPMPSSCARAITD